MVRKERLTDLTFFVRLGVYLVLILPLILLLIRAVNANLGFNPIETALRLTGRVAIAILILSLFVTPLRQIINLKGLASYRKTLGIFAFVYALIHILIYVWIDYKFEWMLIWRSITNSRFILLGLLAFIILLLLFLTSFSPIQKSLGKNWKKIHRLVYVAAFAAVLHFGLAGKRDVFRLQGDFLLPLIAFVVLLLLLFFRIPKVAKRLAGVNKKSHFQE